jgi:hypothetical protein
LLRGAELGPAAHEEAFVAWGESVDAAEWDAAVVNEGKVEHTFTIPSQHIDAVLQRGRRARVKVSFPRSGRTLWVWRFHVAFDMVGELVSTTSKAP